MQWVKDAIRMQGGIVHLMLEKGLSLLVCRAVERCSASLHEQAIMHAEE